MPIELRFKSVPKMKPLRVLSAVIEETQMNLKTSSEDESQLGTLALLEPPPPPTPDCTRLYLWISVAVIVLASLIIAGILTFFCRRNRDGRSSLSHIITNIELQNSRESGDESSRSEARPHFQFHAITGDNIKLTMVERY
ncbi:uncharacterized protein LOC109545000 isoform X1 [Dendroctonus ponderosae]|uniref:uncharacterized protein LOC109545000 isoform X1 n=2 Tax=Dendroctonus ponderosae TaxID=77166 RepID=UPI002035CD6B|nr:uncharacterized protein LOC109545000 isoform X1 [Dendroctonus ponderosae]